MSLNSCPFCEQVNPPEAKFCLACGGALHLAPCPRCGAVSDVTAATCYQCNSPLPGRKGEAEPAPTAAAAPQPSPRWRPAAMIAGVAFAAIVAMGYYGYRPSSLVEVPQPAAASGGRPASTVPAKSDETAQPARPAAAPPETPLADRAPAVETEPRADREPEEMRQARTAAGRIVRSRSADAGTASRQAPIRQELCTEAVAAVGLCTMSPDQKKQAEAAASNKAALAPPEAAVADRAGRQELPGQGACTEAFEALGLCTRGSTQKGE